MSVLPRIARKRRTTCLVGRLEAAQKSAGSKRQPWPTGVTKREVEFLCQSIQGTGYDWVFTSIVRDVIGLRAERGVCDTARSTHIYCTTHATTVAARRRS